LISSAAAAGEYCGDTRLTDRKTAEGISSDYSNGSFRITDPKLIVPRDPPSESPSTQRHPQHAEHLFGKRISGGVRNAEPLWQYARTVAEGSKGLSLTAEEMAKHAREIAPDSLIRYRAS
jgi:hypothetical protein